MIWERGNRPRTCGKWCGVCREKIRTNPNRNIKFAKGNKPQRLKLKEELKGHMKREKRVGKREVLRGEGMKRGGMKIVR